MPILLVSSPLSVEATAYDATNNAAESTVANVLVGWQSDGVCHCYRGSFFTIGTNYCFKDIGEPIAAHSKSQLQLAYVHVLVEEVGGGHAAACMTTIEGPCLTDRVNNAALVSHEKLLGGNNAKKPLK